MGAAKVAACIAVCHSVFFLYFQREGEHFQILHTPVYLYSFNRLLLYVSKVSWWPVEVDAGSIFILAFMFLRQCQQTTKYDIIEGAHFW